MKQKRLKRFSSKGFSVTWPVLLSAAVGVGCFFWVGGDPLWAATEAKDFKVRKTAFYQDVFDQNFYSEAVNQLDLGRWGRKLFRKKIPSADVNIFDEVPDSSFFTNRQGREKLSTSELEQGFRETDGPDLSQPLLVTTCGRQGIYSYFIVKDIKGDVYTLRFDVAGNSEMNTAAEIIASRFYYALGYNVPQYSLCLFKQDQLKAEEGAPVYDNSGFIKKLTGKILEEYLILVPSAQDGFFRASAQKALSGEKLGNFSFESRRKEDPQDPVNHRDRREIRTLAVFSAWLNNYDVRESNTRDMRVTKDGRDTVKHYLVDFTSALGASPEGAKPPMFGYEYLADYGEAFKSFLALGFREKPWQKKWRLSGHKANVSPAVGYFSNELFDPAKYKAQLPYEAFRLVTDADGFWAAKTMMRFSDEDIRAIVKAGQYSRQEDADYIAKTLIERRDRIAKYWFSKTNPLDEFDFSSGKLTFKDLAVEYGFEASQGVRYQITVFFSGDEQKEIVKTEAATPEIDLQPERMTENKEILLKIQTSRPSSKILTPSVTVRLNASGVQEIRHAD